MKDQIFICVMNLSVEVSKTTASANIFNQNPKLRQPSKEVLENGIKDEILRVSEDACFEIYGLAKQIENTLYKGHFRGTNDFEGL